MKFSGNDLAPASPPAPTSLLDNLLKFGSAALSLVQQQQLAKTNLKLIQAGQQPIPVSAVPGLAPTIAVGLDPATKSFLIAGAVGLAAFFLPSILTKRRRR